MLYVSNAFSLSMIDRIREIANVVAMYYQEEE
jgi:hypothetical protein